MTIQVPSARSLNNKKKHPHKISIFDIDNTLIYYNGKNNHPVGFSNYQPITQAVQKLNRKAKDPNCLVLVATNSRQKHAEDVLKKLKIPVKTFFHRHDLEGTPLPHGRLELNIDNQSFSNPAVDCAFGVSEIACAEARLSNKKFSENKAIRYEQKPSVNQVRDALLQLHKLDAFDPQALQKVTIWGDRLRTDGMLAKNLATLSQELFGKSIKVKYVSIDPYKKDIKNIQQSMANYCTKKYLKNF